MLMSQLEQLFAEIATAIRYKLGTYDTIIADNFPDEIAKIGGSPIPEYDWSWDVVIYLNQVDFQNADNLYINEV